MSSCTTAEAARRSGFSIDTLRYYEKAGLVPPVARDRAGRRRYADIDLGWLALVRCLRDTGMPLADIKTFVELTQAGRDHTAARVTMLQAHDQHIEHQIATLRRDQAYLCDKLDVYQQRDHDSFQ